MEPKRDRPTPLNHKQKLAVGFALTLIVVVWTANGIYLAVLATRSLTLFWTADFCQWVLLPTAAALLLANTASVRPGHYGYGDIARHNRPVLAFQTLGVAVTAGLAWWLSGRTTWALLNYPTGFFSFANVFPGGLAGRVAWLYSGISAGIVESAFFIGLPWLLYRAYRAAPSRVLFTVLVSTVFALAHWEQGPHGIVAAFFFHLVACWWYFACKSLWPVAFGHTIVDLIAFA